MEPTIYEFKLRGDERGSLVAIEVQADIPFAIQRVYYIFGTQAGVSRGLHAHRNLRQVMVCVNGSCQVVLDDGLDKVAVPLNDRCQGLLLDRMVWHEMYDFSSDCVLLVLASDFYDEADYIRDYSEFMSLVKTQTKS
jgi:dTDP-4-dehydrorhamnose 3,5-epimerase-like enzyme